MTEEAALTSVWCLSALPVAGGQLWLSDLLPSEMVLLLVG